MLHPVVRDAGAALGGALDRVEHARPRRGRRWRGSPSRCAAGREAANSASSSSAVTRRMPVPPSPHVRGAKSAAVPEPSAPSAYSFAQPKRIVSRARRAARPSAVRGRRPRRCASAGMPSVRRSRPSTRSAEIGQRRVRVAERRIGADAVLIGVVAGLAGAGDAEAGELAQGLRPAAPAARRPGGGPRAAPRGRAPSRAGCRSARRARPARSARPSGSGVVAPRPAARRAAADAHAEWPSWLVRNASRSPTAASQRARPGRQLRLGPATTR